MSKVKCSRCGGEGKYEDYEDTCFAAYFKRCERCGGTGYIGEEVVGETISYSSSGAGRSQPEGNSLVRKARQSHAGAVTEGILQIPVGMLRVTQYALPLCDALEEREREVERLRQQLVKRERKIASVDREVVRLWKLVNDIEALAASEAEQEERG